MIRILIADDHAVVRRGVKQIIGETRDMAVADECGNGQELLDKIGNRNHDLILLDISMPGRNGLEILKQIKCLSPDIPVLILSMHPEEQYAIRALRAGACGYLTKDSAPDELLAAIRKVSRGAKYVSSSLSETLVLALAGNGVKSLHETLSDREYQILCLIASGKTVKGIADDLCLSNKTISTYRSRILQKMSLNNNAEMTSYAIKNGLPV